MFYLIAFNFLKYFNYLTLRVSFCKYKLMEIYLIKRYNFLYKIIFNFKRETVIMLWIFHLNSKFIKFSFVYIFKYKR